MEEVMQSVRHKPLPHKESVVTKAVQRAAGALGLKQKELAEILGVSESKLSRLEPGAPLDSDKKEFELALLFLRMFRSLDTLVGGDEEKARAWLHATNRYLGDVPLSLIKQIWGLTHVVEYLDAVRGHL
jgi:transcriptional regulator with XRE-family HTH domain